MKSRDDQIRPNEDQFNALKQLHDDIVSGINKFGFIKFDFHLLEVPTWNSFYEIKSRQKNRLVNQIL